jgi:hypothetical protein
LATGRRFKTATLTEVNRNVFDFARRSPSGQSEWDFFCECGQEDCHEYVFMTLDAYVSLHDGGEPVLADGHHLSQVERARRLRADADALQRQAKHQVGRAKKNVPPRD